MNKTEDLKNILLVLAILSFVFISIANIETDRTTTTELSQKYELYNLNDVSNNTTTTENKRLWLLFYTKEKNTSATNSNKYLRYVTKDDDDILKINELNIEKNNVEFVEKDNVSPTLEIYQDVHNIKSIIGTIEEKGDKTYRFIVPTGTISNQDSYNISLDE